MLLDFPNGVGGYENIAKVEVVGVLGFACVLLPYSCSALHSCTRKQISFPAPGRFDLSRPFCAPTGFGALPEIEPGKALAQLTGASRRSTDLPCVDSLSSCLWVGAGDRGDSGEGP